MPALVELAGVTKRYGAFVALDQFDLLIERGEMLARLGPNGAGKSTAIGLLLGLQQPDAGRVRLFDGPPRLESRRRTSVMMQEAALVPELKVRELVDLTASYYPEPLTAEAAMDLTATTPLANRPYGKLSGGQKRQAQFAMAVVGRPALLFLDEPTVGLDIDARETMWATLRRLIADGRSIVLTTHYLEEAEALADRVAVMAKGRLVASGGVREICASVARKQITCITSVSAQAISAWPGVEAVMVERGRTNVTVAEAEEVVRLLLSADAGLRELEVHRAGLAEAFSALTREAS
jgi:ABC-2 type transport system ATP-binding protein